MKLRGTPVKLQILVVGNKTNTVDSEVFKFVILGKDGIEVSIEAYGIQKVSSAISHVDMESLAKLFTKATSDISRANGGEIDLLVGMQYAAYHPVKIEEHGHLLLMKNQFGSLIAGSHPSIKEQTKLIVKHAIVLHAAGSIGNFFELENLGTNSNPKCGGCLCGSCHPGGKNMTLQEEEELKLIEDGISFNKETGRWLANYPWVKDSKNLSNNHSVAVATLKATEKRLLRGNHEHAKLYSRQMKDLVDRGAARYVSKEELKLYEDTLFYISHHAVLNANSKSTPCRIVFNSSAKFKGFSLNDCLAKGPSLLNDILGILLRFRENAVAFVGDISKMFHCIDIPVKDQMTHLFLWRNLEQGKEPQTLAMTRVNMGDKPSSAIAQTALRKTALESQQEFSMASKIILRNSYMDDIPGSVCSEKEATQVMKDIDTVLATRGFKIKEWVWTGMKFNGSSAGSNDQRMVQLILSKGDEDSMTKKVLRMHWN